MFDRSPAAYKEGKSRMKIQIRSGTIELTAAQRAKLEQQIIVALAGLGDWVASVVVRLSVAKQHPGYSCEVQIIRRPQVVSVEQSDSTMTLAVEHAAHRAARSVRRVIARECGADH
jgi:ribosome-associated translation inhibitor RaiA